MTANIVLRLMYLTIMTPFKLQAGSEDHEDSPQHHVRGLVEEVIVQLGGVQKHLPSQMSITDVGHFFIFTCSPLYLLDLLHQYQTATGRPIMKMRAYTPSTNTEFFSSTIQAGRPMPNCIA